MEAHLGESGPVSREPVAKLTIHFLFPRIGFGCASVLLEHGAHITVISSQQAHVDDATARLNAHAAKFDPSLPPIKGHVGNVKDEAAFTDILRSLAPLDHIVFTSVDRIIRGPLEHTDLPSVQDLFGVKFWGSVVVAKALAKYDIVAPGGSLTLTSGVAAIRASKNASIGGALNGGVNSLTQGLALDLAAKRIRVNTVVPGFCQTELWDKQGHSKKAQDEVLAKFAAKLSVGFVGSPEDVAEAYLFLIRANYANGTTVVIGKVAVTIFSVACAEGSSRAMRGERFADQTLHQMEARISKQLACHAS